MLDTLGTYTETPLKSLGFTKILNQSTKAEQHEICLTSLIFILLSCGCCLFGAA